MSNKKIIELQLSELYDVGTKSFNIRSDIKEEFHPEIIIFKFDIS